MMKKNALHLPVIIKILILWLGILLFVLTTSGCGTSKRQKERVRESEATELREKIDSTGNSQKIEQIHTIETSDTEFSTSNNKIQAVDISRLDFKGTIADSSKTASIDIKPTANGGLLITVNNFTEVDTKKSDQQQNSIESDTSDKKESVKKETTAYSSSSDSSNLKKDSSSKTDSKKDNLTLDRESDRGNPFFTWFWVFVGLGAIALAAYFYIKKINPFTRLISLIPLSRKRDKKQAS